LVECFLVLSLLALDPVLVSLEPVPLDPDMPLDDFEVSDEPDIPLDEPVPLLPLPLMPVEEPLVSVLLPLIPEEPLLPVPLPVVGDELVPAPLMPPAPPAPVPVEVSDALEPVEPLALLEPLEPLLAPRDMMSRVCTWPEPDRLART
jgi:hypothetical protein